MCASAGGPCTTSQMYSSILPLRQPSLGLMGKQSAVLKFEVIMDSEFIQEQTVLWLSMNLGWTYLCKACLTLVVLDRTAT